MAQNPNPTKAENSRLNKDYSFLTTSTLPVFISDKLASFWEDQYPDVKLKAHHPDELINQDGIVWQIARRVPGLNREDTIKPSLKEQHICSKSNEVLQIVTQWQTVTYEFTIFAKDADFLNELVDAFEDFIYFLTPELQARWVNNFIFEEELREDLASPTKSSSLVKRVLRYTAYVHKKYEMSYPLLSKIKMDLNLGVEDIKDQVIVREKNDYDVLDLPEGVRLLTRVSKLPYEEVVQLMREAERLSGPSGVTEVIQENLYIQDLDYTLQTIENKGSTVQVIYWLKNKEGATVPETETAYYISYLKPVKVKEYVSRPGV